MTETALKREDDDELTERQGDAKYEPQTDRNLIR